MSTPVEGIALRRRAHDQHHAVLDYGKAFMKADRERGRAGERAATYASAWRDRELATFDRCFDAAHAG